jgi:alkaline phosphatase D
MIVSALFSCTNRNEQVVKLAFGSCGHEDEKQPILSLAADANPDAFIYLGDNIYGDTDNMDTLRAKYQMLADKPEFIKLKEGTPLYATWDDHDYGRNDAGRHYPFKVESKSLFLNFFGDQGDPTIRDREGIYHTVYIDKAGKRIQIIFPDLRTFRDDLLPYNGTHDGDPRFPYEMDYSPYTTTDSSMIGEQQWRWIEEQLLQPADLRIIASSSQFSITHNGYEAWANFPHEQQRMIDLIKKTKANGVIFISGDVHYAEVSKLTQAGCYPLYDVTSSGITSKWDFATPNDNRIDGPVMQNHFGLLTVNLSKDNPDVLVQIIDVQGVEKIKRLIGLSELSFNNP